MFPYLVNMHVLGVCMYDVALLDMVVSGIYLFWYYLVLIFSDYVN